MTANRARDPLDVLVAEVGGRRRPDVALEVTCIEVFDKAILSLDPFSFDALVATGWQAVLDAGTYHGEFSTPVLDWVDAGLSYDEVLPKLDDETFAKLALVGLTTLATERFVKADEET